MIISAAEFYMLAVELVSTFNDACLRYDSTNFLSLFLALSDLMSEYDVAEMQKRTFVKVIGGRKRGGEIGSIAGTLEDRYRLIERHGLRKLIVRFGDQFAVIEIENIVELSPHECILMGLS